MTVSRSQPRVPSKLAQVVQDGVFLQQFPYPCFQRNNFLSGLYTIQLMQVVTFVPTISDPKSTQSI